MPAPSIVQLARRASMPVVVSCALALSGCATHEPFSYLDGQRWSRVDKDSFDTLIVSVDGKYYTYNSRIRIEPGRHHIVFQARPAPGFRFSGEKALDLEIEPCMRYWFEARKTSSIAQDFEPRVNYKDSIVGCGTGGGSPAGD
jgi:hypothetical protein